MQPQSQQVQQAPVQQPAPALPGNIVNSATVGAALETVAKDGTATIPKIAAIVSDIGGVKAGLKTTEFLTTLLTNVGLIGGGVLASHQVWIQVGTGVAAAIVNVVYVIARTHLKTASLSVTVTSK